jgi:PAS domain S-box-containing protein
MPSVADPDDPVLAALACRHPDMILKLNKNNRFVFANMAALTRLNCSVEPGYGRIHQEVRLPDDLSRFLKKSSRDLFSAGQEKTVSYQSDDMEPSLNCRIKMIPGYSDLNNIDAVLFVIRETGLPQNQEDTDAERIRRLETMVNQLSVALANSRQNYETKINAFQLTERKLKKKEDCFRLVLENVPAFIAICDKNKRYRFVNKNYAELVGLSPWQIIGQKCRDILGHEIFRIAGPQIDKVLSGENVSWEFQAVFNDGQKRWLSCSYIPHINEKERVDTFYAFITDIDMLRRSRDKLKKTNDAMEILLEHREQEKRDLSETIMTNISKEIQPYLDQIAKDAIPDSAKKTLKVIQTRLMDIISPYTHRLSCSHYNLTPTEIRVANLIRQGNTSKEIAGLLNVSNSTLSFHRYNIRKKMGLVNNKVNLHIYLKSLSQPPF